MVDDETATEQAGEQWQPSLWVAPDGTTPFFEYVTGSGLVVVTEELPITRLPLLMPSHKVGRPGDFFDLPSLPKKWPYLCLDENSIDYGPALKQMGEYSIDEFDKLPFYKQCFFALPAFMVWECKSFHSAFLKLVLSPDVTPTVFFVLARPLLERLCFLYRIQRDVDGELPFIYKMLTDMAKRKKGLYGRGLLYRSTETVNWVKKRVKSVEESWMALNSFTHFGSEALQEVLALSHTKNPHRFGWERNTPEMVFGEIDKMLKLFIKMAQQTVECSERIEENLPPIKIPEKDEAEQT